MNMNIISRHVAIAATIGLAAGIGTLMPQMASADKATEVTIVSPVPLPVNGTVNAQQSGTWTVNVNPMGTPVPVRDIDEPGRSPYMATRTANSNNLVFPAVPAGKRLVIEHISYFARFGSAGLQRMLLFASNNQDLMEFQITPIQDGSNYDTVINQPVRAYVDAGFTPVTAVTGINVVSSRATISGYLIDCTGLNQCAPIVR
jgi:hypothetical protein